MKNIIHYMGGGLLAAVIGVGMFGIVGRISMQESGVGEVIKEAEMDSSLLESNYKQAMKAKLIEVAYKPYTTCRVGKRINLQECFVARDGQGKCRDITVAEVRLQNADLLVKPDANGMWRFEVPGIYQVTIQCANEEVVINIPVNG